jgi:DNA-binding GntR family transcriptional regulator
LVAFEEGPSGERQIAVSSGGREPAVHRTLVDLAYATLRRRILDGHLPPGSRLDHEAEAQRLSVSRMPIREALRRLENEGLVEIQSHRAAYVRPLSAADLEDLYVLRIALEGTAGRLGVERIDAAGLDRMRELLPRMAEIVARGDRAAWLAADGEFHETLYAAARRPRLLSIITGLRAEASRYRLLGLANPHEMELGLADHHAIVAACERGDGGAVEWLIRESLERWREMLQALLRE